MTHYATLLPSTVSLTDSSLGSTQAVRIHVFRLDHFNSSILFLVSPKLPTRALIHSLQILKHHEHLNMVLLS